MSVAFGDFNGDGLTDVFVADVLVTAVAGRSRSRATRRARRAHRRGQKAV